MGIIKDIGDSKTCTLQLQNTFRDCVWRCFLVPKHLAKEGIWSTRAWRKMMNNGDLKHEEW